MRFEWDPAKAKANIARHGISFEVAQAVFADAQAVESLDELPTRNDGACSEGRARRF